jgi:Fe-S cluster assembly protein SufD
MKQQNLQNKKPAFLAYSYDGLSFTHREQKPKDNKHLLERLQKKYAQDNVIIVLDGKVYANQIDGVTLKNKANTVIENQFDYLNKTHQNSTLYLQFTKTLNKPVFVVIAGANNVYHYANYEVAKGVSVKLIEQFELYSRAKLNYKVEVVVSPNAQLELTYLEYLQNKKANVISHSTIVQENAKLELNTINLNNANVVHTTTGSLNGNYATSHLNSLHFTNKNYEHANVMQLTHLSKHTNSSIQNFGVVNDTAKLIIDGINVIEKGFSKSEAQQESKIINLSDSSKAIANPQLIINEYDVKAGHSAGVGRLDEDALYYLMSRGLTKKQSIELIVLSHANNLLEKITDKKIKKQIIRKIKNKLS